MTERRQSEGIICIVSQAQRAMFATVRKLVLRRVVPGVLVATIAAYTSDRILNGSSEKPKRRSRKPRNKRKKECQ